MVIGLPSRQTGLIRVLLNSHGRSTLSPGFAGG